MKQDEQLKPCPFCGQQPYIGYLYTKDMQAVTCKNPDCTQSESFSVAEWNTRPGEDALHAEIDRLRAESQLMWAALENCEFNIKNLGPRFIDPWYKRNILLVLRAGLGRRDSATITTTDTNDGREAQ